MSNRQNGNVKLCRFVDRLAVTWSIFVNFFCDYNVNSCLVTYLKGQTESQTGQSVRSPVLPGAVLHALVLVHTYSHIKGNTTFLSVLHKLQSYNSVCSPSACEERNPYTMTTSPTMTRGRSILL